MIHTHSGKCSARDKRPPAAGQADAQRARQRILVADDDPAAVSLIESALAQWYDVDSAGDGEEALEKLKTGSYSLVIADIVMPKMDGFRLLDTMRSDPSVNWTPSIMITATTDSENEIKALSMGAIDILKKPFVIEILRLRVQNICNMENAARVTTQNRLYQQQLAQQKLTLHLMEHDRLTGLYNRDAFYRRVRERLDAEPEKHFVIVRWDIDAFSSYNDSCGTAAGDILLKTLGFNIAAFEDERYIFARLESDHFVVFTETSLIEPVGMLARLDQWAAQFSSAYKINWRLGVYPVMIPSLDPAIMCDRALIALRSVKGSFSERIGWYDAKMRDKMIELQRLTEEMVPALESGQFEVYYQPQVNYSTGELLGAEALVRWNHPEKGLLMPGSFIPLFEHSGAVSRLDVFVWEEVCRQLKKWLAIYGEKTRPISVNVSRIDIYREDLCAKLCALVAKYDIPINMLRLELTESAYMKDAEKLKKAVKRLSEAGFSIEMDDFGSAYSSLNMLKDIPVDILKLDMKFLSTSDSQNKGRGGSILSSIVRMARWLRLPVIAEGVETKEQADYLKSIGCVYMQGYYFGRPAPRNTYEKLLNASVHGALDKYKNIDFTAAERFWDASAQAAVIFNSYVGGTALVERTQDKLELVRANDGFFNELCTTRDRFMPYTLDLWPHFPNGYAKDFADMLDRAVESGGEEVCETPFYPAGSGRPVWARSRARILAKNVGCELFYISVENITEKKNRQAELQQIKDEAARLLRRVAELEGAASLKNGKGSEEEKIN